MQRRLFENETRKKNIESTPQNDIKKETNTKDITLSVTGVFKEDTQRKDNVGRYHGYDEQGNYYSINLLPNGDLFISDTYHKTTLQSKIIRNDIKKTINFLNETYSKKEELVIEVNKVIYRLTAY